MGMLSSPAFGPKVALGYMTVGSLVDVWTGVYWYYFVHSAKDREVGNFEHFMITALLLTGATLMVLGLILGPLGQYARKAELPPKEAEKKEEKIQQTAAATPHPMAPGMVPGMAPGMVPGMVPGMAGQMVPPGYVGGAPAPPPAPSVPVNVPLSG